MAVPLHSFMQVVHSRPCSQMLLPPHSTVAVVARAPVIAEAAAATLLALAALPPVLAEAAAATLLAVAVVALSPVNAEKLLLPPHSLNWPRSRPCSQPQQILHLMGRSPDHEGTACH
jgi:hypothetical protein